MAAEGPQNLRTPLTCTARRRAGHGTSTWQARIATFDWRERPARVMARVLALLGNNKMA